LVTQQTELQLKGAFSTGSAAEHNTWEKMKWDLQCQQSSSPGDEHSPWSLKTSLQHYICPVSSNTEFSGCTWSGKV